jgi:hypothetical protein
MPRTIGTLFDESFLGLLSTRLQSQLTFTEVVPDCDPPGIDLRSAGTIQQFDLTKIGQTCSMREHGWIKAGGR